MSTFCARMLWITLLIVLLGGTGCSVTSPPTAQDNRPSPEASPVSSPAALLATATASSPAIVATTPAATQPTAARQIDNLVAFTKLLGYVRYFHPSDTVATTDWNRFTVQHIEQVIDAPDAAALAEQLTTIFTPYGPTLRLALDGQEAALPPELMLPATQPVSVTMWVHVPMAAFRRKSRELAPGQRVLAEVRDGQRQATLGYSHPDFFEEPIQLTVTDPATPYRAELGGGVTMLLPTALYADAQGTLPHASEKPPTSSAADYDRATRLAAIALTWNALQHL